MVNIKYLHKKRTSHSQARRIRPVPRKHAKTGGQPERQVVGPGRVYLRRPAAFPTLPFSQNRDTDTGQGKEQLHRVGRLMCERSSDDTVKWKKAGNHLSTRPLHIELPPGLTNDEKDDYEKPLNDMDTSEEGKQVEKPISFRSLYPSLRAEIIDQIYSESSTLYLDGYYPVKYLLDLDGKTLNNIMSENEAIWDTPPHHILDMKARNPDKAIDPDTPPPGATRYALKFLQQKGLPTSLLGQWRYLLRETKVTFSRSERDGTDQPNKATEEKDASEIPQSAALEQVQKAEHIDNIVVDNKYRTDDHLPLPRSQQQHPLQVKVGMDMAEQNVPHKLPSYNLNGPSRERQRKPRRIPTPPPNKPIPGHSDPGYDRVHVAHHARLKDAGRYPPGSAQRALSIERNVQSTAQYGHRDSPPLAKGPRNGEPVPMTPMASMKHVTPYIGLVSGTVVEGSPQSRPRPSTPARVREASQQGSVTMSSKTPSDSPSSTGVTSEPLPRPPSAPSTPIQEPCAALKAFTPKASGTPDLNELSSHKSPPKQNPNLIPRSNLVDSPSKQALPSVNGISPGKVQLRNRNQNHDPSHIFGLQLNKYSQEFHSQARYQHTNLPRVKSAASPQHLQSNQQQNQHPQNGLRSPDQNLNKTLDQLPSKLPQNSFHNVDPPSAQGQDYKSRSPYQIPVQHPTLGQQHHSLPPYPYSPTGHPSGTSSPTPQPQSLPVTNPPKTIRKTPVPPPPNVAIPRSHHGAASPLASLPQIATSTVPDASAPAAAPASPTFSTIAVHPPAHSRSVDPRIILTPNAAALNAHFKKVFSAQERSTATRNPAPKTTRPPSRDGHDSSSKYEYSVSPTMPVGERPAGGPATKHTTTTATTTATASSARVRPTIAVVEINVAAKRKRGRPAKSAASTSAAPTAASRARTPSAASSAADGGARSKNKKLKANAEEVKKPAQSRMRML